MTQCEKIVSYLERHGSITQREALRECGCMRLASRICDLRKAGYGIRSEMVEVENADGTRAFVARYSLGVS